MPSGFDALRPGGLLAVTETDIIPRFLPEDIGVGRPGVEARLHAGPNEAPAAGWAGHVVRAGFVLEAERPFVSDLHAPLPAATARYARAGLRKLSSHLGAVIDDAGHHLRRADLSVRTTRTTWVGRRPDHPVGGCAARTAAPDRPTAELPTRHVRRPPLAPGRVLQGRVGLEVPSLEGEFAVVRAGSRAVAERRYAARRKRVRCGGFPVQPPLPPAR
ncbi:hypothetical protein [Streptomyces brevispora]|uniref:hypothetical protein n=1 Tax=Streptomyces brevispora TaxID=887462 RepID=UPI0011A25B56|nr:hypothetical protein [Streptomyces brevispora]